MKELIKAIAALICFILLIPLFILYLIRLFSFMTCVQLLSLVPGFFGVTIRKVFYKMTLKKCGSDLNVGWMGAIKTSQAQMGNNVYIGVGSWVGFADIGDDTMLADHITVLSGSEHHGIRRLDIPMRLQEGKMTCVTIGKDCWIGAGAIIMADVADHSVVGSGSVVTKKFAAYDIIAGVPAKKIKSRKG